MDCFGYDSMKKATFLLFGIAFILHAGCGSAPTEQEEISLGTPVLLLPLNNSDTADSVLLDWDDVPDVKRYQVQVSKNAAFTALIYDETAVGRSEAIIGDLERFVTLYWRSRAIELGGITGDWSTTMSFRPVRQAFFASYPQQVLPTNNSKGHETDVILAWEPVPNAISYHLVVTIDEDMLLYEVDLENLKSTSFFLEGLVLTYPYWWKIRTLSAEGYSDWSPIWIFEVKFGEN